MSTVLEYNRVSICYDAKKVIRDVSFSLGSGEILGIVGESGSGKSTLLKAAMGLLGEHGCVTEGDIYYYPRRESASNDSDERKSYPRKRKLSGACKGNTAIDLPDLKVRDLRRICGREIALISQDAGSGFCPVRKVLDLIYEEGRAHQLYGRGRREKERCAEDAAEIFYRIGIRDPDRVLDSYSFELSGGMNQRVGIVMALLLRPEIILADEPTSALDAMTQKKVAELLYEIREQTGISIILVTHNIGLAGALSDHLFVLRDGLVQEYGVTRQVLQNPASAYTKSLIEAVPHF